MTASTASVRNYGGSQQAMTSMRCPYRRASIPITVFRNRVGQEANGLMLRLP